MTTYMLDTNIVSYAFKSRPASVLERLRATRPEDLCISAVTLAELRFGASKSRKAERYHDLIDTFARRVRPLAFDHAAADEYGRVRADLTSKGKSIGPLDTLIAGHALSVDAVLVTNNVDEFSRVAGLRIENWAAA